MYAMNFMQVGANIQEELVRKDMTQQGLADSLGISKQVMNKIIKGTKAINVNELSKIAEILHTTTDSLLTVRSKPAVADSLGFMGDVHDRKTLEKVNLIRTAIDEIHLLEELLDD